MGRWGGGGGRQKHTSLSLAVWYSYLRIQSEGAEAGATANFDLHFVERVLEKIIFLGQRKKRKMTVDLDPIY